MPLEQFLQDELLTKMKAFGYGDKALDGHCYGFSEMAINAFIQGNMSHFVERLKLLKALSDEDIKKLTDPIHFKIGTFDLPIKLDSGADISPLEAYAFFDGVSVYQRPGDFKRLFEGAAHISQASTKASMLFRPQAGDTDTEQVRRQNLPWPKVVSNVCGIFNREELKDVFDTLIETSTVPFSINANSTNHSISIHFDPEKQSVLFMDPNKMPGSKYALGETAELADAFMYAFISDAGIKPDSCADLSFYVDSKNAGAFQRTFKHAKEKKRFIEATKITPDRVAREDKTESRWLHIAAQYGRTDLVQELIEEGAEVNHTKSNGRTALHYACQNGYLETVDKLIVAGANVNIADENGTTALHLACLCAHKDIVKRLLEAHADVNLKRENSETALHFACQSGDSEIIDMILKEDVDINAEDKEYRTALSVVCQKEDHDMFAQLIEAGADPNTRMDYAMTPLLYACKHNLTELVKKLVAQGADIHARTNRGVSPLIFASAAGNLEIVRLLLDKKADLNRAESDDGKSPLHFAAENGHTDIMTQLLSAGARINAKTFQSQLPIELAARQRQKAAFEILYNHPDSSYGVNNQNQKTFILACQAGHIKIAEECLNSGAIDINEAEKGLTALMLASQNGDSEMVKWLISKGASVNLPDHTMGTPTALSLALANGQHEVADMLIEHATSVDDITINGLSPLEYACEHKLNRLIMSLAEKGCDLTYKFKDTSTGLDYIFENDLSDELESLIRRNLLDITDPSTGYHLLQAAIVYKHDKLSQLLIEKGVDVNYVTPDAEACTHLHLACDQGNLRVVKLLLESGADMNAQTSAYSSRNTLPLQIAVKFNNLNVVEELIAQGVDINQMSDYGITALSSACIAGHLDIVTRLLDAQADPMLSTNKGEPSIFGAVENGHVEIIDLLIRHGVDINAKSTVDGLSLLELACESDNPNQADVLRYLIKKGAKYDSHVLLDYAMDYHLDELAHHIVTDDMQKDISIDELNQFFDWLDTIDRDNAATIVDEELNRDNKVLLSLCAKGLTFLTHRVLDSIPLEKLATIIDENMTRSDNILQALADGQDADAVYDLFSSLKKSDPTLISKIFLGEAHDINKGNLLTTIAKDKDQFIQLLAPPLPQDDAVKILLIRNQDGKSVIDHFYEDEHKDGAYTALLDKVPQKYHGLLELRREYSKRALDTKEYKAHDKLETLDKILKHFDPTNQKTFGIEAHETGAAISGRFKERLQALKTACSTEADSESDSHVRPE